MNQDIRIDVSRAKSTAVGSEHGVSPQELRAIEPRVAEAHRILQKERTDGVYGFWDLHQDAATLKDVQATAAAFRRDTSIENVVVLGIGGSALGMTALLSALRPPFYNLLTRRGRGGFPRLFVMDNIDPMSFRAMLRLCPPQKTLYNVISKSGGTAETMSQLMIVLEALEKKVGKDKVSNHLVVTTNPRGKASSLLHPIADHYRLKEFTVPLNVGGRFSVFSPVGLFPAALAGIDVAELLEGCAAMSERCSLAGLDENPAYLRAAYHYLSATLKGKSISVMMPYSDGLRHVADWYKQLWAESLGKRYDLSGNEVFAGQTPVNALGATDQHSQIQLYREGPNDKIINVVEVKRFDKTLRLPNVLPDLKEIDYLRGQTMNKLMAAELAGTVDALRLSRRPVVKITLPRVNAHAIGQLLYMLEVETAMAGRLFNVNTFDQPGVEEGKEIARKLMAQSTAGKDE